MLKKYIIFDTGKILESIIESNLIHHKVLTCLGKQVEKTIQIFMFFHFLKEILCLQKIMTYHWNHWIKRHHLSQIYFKNIFGKRFYKLRVLFLFMSKTLQLFVMFQIMDWEKENIAKIRWVQSNVWNIWCGWLLLCHIISCSQ